MARRAKDPSFGSEQKEHQITEALDRKRRQIDQEIAEFKSRKEHEYKDFERQLRSKSKESDGQNALQNQCKRGRYKQINAVAGAGSRQTEEATEAQKESDREPGQEDPRLEMENLGAKSIPGSSRDPPDQPTLYERGRLFQGLFTPGYLPSVGDTLADDGDRSRDLLINPPFNSGDRSAARLNNSAMLSLSAETVPPSMTSPPLPPARPLSSSVPPDKPSHHRRDSSRSDTSIASLRSSLRDPNQPRSPKRVLFSIDDTVVSPSASPIAQRSKSSTQIKATDSVDKVGGFEKFEVIRNQNGNGSAVNRSRSNNIHLSSSSVTPSAWAASLSTFGRATESGFSNPSPSASGADDFEHLGSDDLFTFDEHMGRAGRHKPQETDPEDEYDEDEEVQDKKSKDPLTASSPHAGSLPIEIKWPGRRDGRG